MIAVTFSSYLRRDYRDHECPPPRSAAKLPRQRAALRPSARGAGLGPRRKTGAPGRNTGKTGAPGRDTGNTGAPGRDTGNTGAPGRDTGNTGAPGRNTGNTGNTGRPGRNTGNTGTPGRKRARRDMLDLGRTADCVE